MEQLGFRKKDDWMVRESLVARRQQLILNAEKDDMLTSMFDDVYNVFFMFMILNVYHVWKLFPFSHFFYFNSPPKIHLQRHMFPKKNVPPMLTLSFPVPF